MTHISYENLASNSNPYSLRLINQSSQNWTFYVYQTRPNQQSANVFSTVWFCSPYIIMPDNQITFKWSIDYCMLWGETGMIVPGVTFIPGGIQSANLMSINKSTFSTSPGPHLTAPVKGDPAGSLIIEDDTVPHNQFGVGIGMSGAATFVTSAQSKINYVFTPIPFYWIAAGTNVQVGTILNNTSTIPQSQEVTFPPGIYSLAYALNKDGKWVLQS